MYKLLNMQSRFLIPFIVLFFMIQPMKAQMLIDSIIVEGTKQHVQGFPDKWKQSSMMIPDNSDIIMISGLQVGQKAGEFEWRKAEEALRASRLFRSVHLEIDTLDARNVTVYIIHEPALPEQGPGIFVNLGGSATAIGGIYHTRSFQGALIDLLADIQNRTELGIGPDVSLAGMWNNAFRSGLSFGLGLRYHQFMQGITATVMQNANPMGGLFYGASLNSREGMDFLFEENSTRRITQNAQEYSVWGGWLLPRKDNLYFTVKATQQKAVRGLPATVQAFDNTRSILFGFGSLADRTRVINGSDIPLGAWGSAVLGRIMPSLENGESYYYVGGTVEQSELTLNNDLFIRGMLTAGSGLLRGAALNTALDASFQAQYMIQPDLAIMLNSKVRASWNWNDFRQLILDNDAGVRGLPLNGIIGNNRMIVNVMMAKDFGRLASGFRLGLSAFADMGTLWNKGRSILQSSWNTSVGGGILILAEGRSFQTGKPLLRIEYAHLLRGGGGIVISTDYPFTLFSSHQYSLPTVIGKEIDVE